MRALARGWQVHYSRNGAMQVSDYATAEAAIEAACDLIDEGCYVFGIGAGPQIHALTREEIERFCNARNRTKR